MRRAVAYLMLSALCVAPACKADGERPGYVVLPDMAYSVPYDAFDRSPVDGKTLPLPPEGTVRVGQSLFPYGPDAEEALRAGRELRNPLPLAGESMENDLRRGEHVYDVFCAVCHGAGGEGDGPIIGRFPNPPSLLGEHSLQMPDGQIYHVIYYGQGLMPPYLVQVREADRWRLVSYIRALQAQAQATDDEGEAS